MKYTYFKRTQLFFFVYVLSLFLYGCKNDKQTFDASGSFEAEETIISAEANGIIKALRIEEGKTLEAGEQIGFIDSVQLYLRKKQLEAQMEALLGKKPNITVQLASLKEQLATAKREQQRMEKLVKADAIPTKQLDDVNAQVDLLTKQIEAQQSTLELTTRGIQNDASPLLIQIDQLNDQLEKCVIINPVKGTVLTQYAEVNEMAAQGKALYKIADLSTILLRAYISGNQIPLVKLNQKVTVHTDDGKGGYISKEGVIIWISDKAEFTPKTIQTKDERANMVYAIKVKLTNDGSYKIGMYGEINFE
jgi:HlyD family secretion protein